LANRHDRSHYGVGELAACRFLHDPAAQELRCQAPAGGRNVPLRHKAFLNRRDPFVLSELLEVDTGGKSSLCGP
jgi:hypothetical protein